MIKVEKYENQFGNQLCLVFDNNDKMNINFCGNLDLYFTPESDEEKHNYHFEITKKDRELFNIFYKLYKKIKSYKGLSDAVDERFKRQDKNSKYPLVKNNVITWISDDDPEEIASRMNIYYNNGKIMIDFSEGMHQEGLIAKSIRLRTSGSRYKYMFVPFIELYGSICNTDFDYHQITINEYMLSLRKKISIDFSY